MSLIILSVSSGKYALSFVSRYLQDFYIAGSYYRRAPGVFFEDGHLTEVFTFFDSGKLDLIVLAEAGIYESTAFQKLEKASSDVTFIDDDLAVPESLLNNTHIAIFLSDQ